MKAARLHEYHKPLVVEDVPDPSIRNPNDVIIRVGAAGLCRTDLHIIEGVWIGKVNVTLPYILGHENAGWVEEVGPAVRSVKPGDAVILHPLVSCGVCRGCRSGEDMYCENGEFPGLTRDGGFAEYLLTNERAIVKLPDGVRPVDVAPLADAGITAYRAAKKVARDIPPDGRVVVIGIGGLGHIAIQCLRHLSSVQIIAVDRRREALDLAKECGADQVVLSDDHVVEHIRDITHGGADAVVDFVGEGEVVDQAISMLRKGGTYYVVGYGGRVNIPTIDLIFGELRIVGNLVGNYRELSELMAMAGAGKVKLRTQTYSLKDINQAIEDLSAGRVNGRAVIVP